ncbi:MAG: tRNA (N(6)-L-threonylcarbamoyladenosine(37)-C(2))-methylthiotransferase MtaB [Desulfobacterales bacterium]|nr:tRNA (N(6)-L-threonylcarbamoyladenosine(37)-C(2))-methylthiotransferase MtaB [Desulfobacterales bacterium]
MARFKISTLGCKVNQSESDVIAAELKGIHWLPANGCESPEMVVINTCTVTQKAAMQSRQAVRQAIRSNPNAQIVVTGCYAQTEPKALENINGVDLIVGNTDKHRIVELIRAGQAHAADGPIIICNDNSQIQPLKPSVDAIGGSRTRPVLKIQDGCNSACTYCIVPRARGPSRSLPPESVLAKIQSLSQAGYFEIVLSGVHLGHYGRDLTPETRLSDLLARIERSTTMPRVRLSSIEPLETTDELIEQVAESSRICRHFHIPLQSGDDHILKKMKRPYGSDDFSRIVHKISQRFPEAAIGVDILVGFPGETEAAFSNTYEFVQALPVSYLHVFPFSVRPGTPAANYTGKVAPEIIKQRCAHMRCLGDAKRRDFNQRFIGLHKRVLFESARHSATGHLKGLTSNYLTVLVDADDAYMNQLSAVRLTERFDGALRGVIGQP